MSVKYYFMGVEQSKESINYTEDKLVIEEKAYHENSNLIEGEDLSEEELLNNQFPQVLLTVKDNSMSMIDPFITDGTQVVDFTNEKSKWDENSSSRRASIPLMVHYCPVHHKRISSKVFFDAYGNVKPEYKDDTETVYYVYD